MDKIMNTYQCYRDKLCRIVYSCLLLLLVYEFFSKGLVHQLQAPTLIYPYADMTYIIMNASGILDFIVKHYLLACLFDAMLFLCCIVLIIFPRKRVFSYIFLSLYFIYMLIYCNYGCHHVHSKIGALLISIPFLFTANNFAWIWQGLRYYTLYLFSSAFLWKLLRGSWIHKGQGASIFENNMVPVMYRNPDHPLRPAYDFLLHHPGIADAFFTCGALLEGLFLVGFFTKRYDRGLIIVSLMLFTGFLLFTDAFAYELLILNLTLYYNKTGVFEKRKTYEAFKTS